MTLPLHVGLEHHSLLWLVATALLAFVAGLGVNLYRSRSTGSDARLAETDEE